ncbi:hypothetical protein MARA_01160 (plasmid) [Mycolicibacterium arabiense]|uniref:Uncharacterized protein n=1 Tax=Mycolicibacterium arabiense TaxID=1286181 RepID=A0A7I7RRK7_9MYCO|nr:hypothetical protein MARA_01160 [Mycolicibacterium arabiense]
MLTLSAVIVPLAVFLTFNQRRTSLTAQLRGGVCLFAAAVNWVVAAVNHLGAESTIIDLAVGAALVVAGILALRPRAYPPPDLPR